MSKNVVKVAGLEYEAEALNVITEGPALRYALDLLREYTDANYSFTDDEEGNRSYNPVTAKEKREFGILNNSFSKINAILAADRNNVIESAEQLLQLLRDDKDSFEKLYQAAIKSNPSLDREEKAEVKDTDPLGK